MTRFASLSLLFMAATRAFALSSAGAVESQTGFDFKGPLTQSGYVTPAYTEVLRRARTRAKVRSNFMVKGEACTL